MPAGGMIGAKNYRCNVGPFTADYEGLIIFKVK